MIKAAIFDLGNVLLHFDHRIIARRFSTRVPGVLDASKRPVFVRLAEEFERGILETDAFFAGAERALEFSGAVDLPAFSAMWNDIFWRNEELVSRLPDLSRRIRLVLLSNTNALHIEYAQRRFPEVFAPFHERMFSCETGLLKPDPAAFTEALRRASATPEETLYFDDIKRYTDAAAALGIHAYQFISTASAVDILRAYEVM